MNTDDGVCLRFKAHENQRVGGQLVHDWLLLRARELGLPGGMALRGIAGYGRHGTLQEEHFFELTADLPVEIGFLCTAQQAQDLLDAAAAVGLSLFYSMAPARYGWTGAGSGVPAATGRP